MVPPKLERFFWGVELEMGMMRRRNLLAKTRDTAYQRSARN
jgi:hypothetical protein